jgi:hypothetical protein
MSEKFTKTIPVSSGAEAFLAQMKELGSVRYMFANTGTDHGPLIEAMARTAKEDPRDIQPLSCRTSRRQCRWRMVITT